MMIILPLPLFTVGQWLRLGTKKFKLQYLKLTVTFLQFVIIIPTIIFLYDKYWEMKRSIFSNEGFLWFRSATSEEIPVLTTLLLSGCILSIMPKILFGWSHGGKKLTTFILAMFIGLSTLLYVSWNDYSGIHETKGIVTSKWTGVKEEVGWAEIDNINIIPFVGKRAGNQYGSESSFAWHLEIIQLNGKKKVYKHWGFSNYSMNEALKVKNKIKVENISLTIGRMNEVTKEWYEVEIEIEKVNRKLSDDFFTISK